METIDEDSLIYILEYLNYSSKWNFIHASNFAFRTFVKSNKLLKSFTLNVNEKNIAKLVDDRLLCNLPLRNIKITFKSEQQIHHFVKILNYFKKSLITLELINCTIQSFNNFNELLSRFEKLESITLINCTLNDVGTLSPVNSLKSIVFDNCNDNIFKVFSNQNTIEKIQVISECRDWNRLPIKEFNQICQNSKNLNQVTLSGAGTGSYFDSDEFPFKITKLETTMISFHWYVGIRGPRVNFLQSQKGHLKELTIHKLPYDFDGGRVLKYIIEEMNLETFYYGRIPLILNSKKQNIIEFQASEIQISAMFEMLRQFPWCKKIKLLIFFTDIACDEIEKIINPKTLLFDNISEFEIEDNSEGQYNLGTFLDLLKNLKNVKKLSLTTKDEYINSLLEEFLPNMENLNELYLPSTADHPNQRYQIIRNSARNLQKLHVPVALLDTAKQIFGNAIEIIAIDEEENDDQNFTSYNNNNKKLKCL